MKRNLSKNFPLEELRLWLLKVLVLVPYREHYKAFLSLTQHKMHCVVIVVNVLIVLVLILDFHLEHFEQLEHLEP